MDTPIEKYFINGKEIFVKREDLFHQEPSLAKLRGIELIKNKLIKTDVNLVGVLDTRISKAGWGISKLFSDTKIKVKCFYPKLKSEIELPEIQKKEKENGAEVIGLQAGRFNILFSQAKKITEKENGFMFPAGLVLNETKEAVSLLIDGDYDYFRTIIVSLGTGTICSGIISGLERNNLHPKVYGISCGMKTSKIKKRIENLLNKKLPENIFLIEPSYNYYDEAKIETPFPSSPYYDKKAFDWLIKNYDNLEKPILFWNIGV